MTALAVCGHCGGDLTCPDCDGVIAAGGGDLPAAPARAVRLELDVRDAGDLADALEVIGQPGAEPAQLEACRHDLAELGRQLRTAMLEWAVR